VSVAGIQLVVTDLDGTFWHLDHDVHPATRAAVDELARRGVSLLVATGRRLHTTAVPLARVGLTPPAVVLNGSLGVDLASGDRFHTLPIDTVAATAILAAFRAEGIEPCVYVDHAEIEVYLAPEPGTHPQHAANLAPQADVDDLARVVAEEVVLGFSILGRPFEVLQPVVDRLDGAGVPHLDKSIEYVGQASLTVTQPGISKWEGVVAWCRHAGIDPGAVLAIGDGPNDVELLEGAAVAVAPGDSHESALALADHVVGPAAEGGWAGLLDIVA
jgi:hydroxymethylpyrimidine pyrophosphatase-like HAD family hydrolase